MFELDVRFNILFAFFIGLDVRFLFLLDIGFSFHLWLDIWSIFFLIEIDLYIVPILKLGDDISILLL